MDGIRASRQHWFWPHGLGRFRARAAADEDSAPGIASEPETDTDTPRRLRERIGTAAFAFRGFDVSNLGRSDELLEHAAYGPVVRATLQQVSEIASGAVGRRVDLVARVETRAASSLDTFADDVALIVAMEMAQMRLLEQFFEVAPTECKFTFGYSIGELSSLVVGGVFTLEQLLPVPLEMAPDCADLARDAVMGVLFTRGATLNEADVQQLCAEVRSTGRGLIGPSAFLAPNTALILGQPAAYELFDQLKDEFIEGKVVLRRNGSLWPPLHSPLVWQRNIPNRTAMALYRAQGGTHAPKPKVVSCVTGDASYERHNCRDLLIEWTDHPQRLWDVVDEVLNAGVETVIHVGPAPNLIPATFARLSNNVAKQLGSGYLHKLGKGMVQQMNKHAWLAQLLPQRASLLRAPFIEHVILEDWLLKQQVA